MKVISIDPGKKGALCCYNGLNVEILDMPVIGSEIESRIIFEWIMDKMPFHIFIEHSQAIPGVQSTTSAFKFGYNFGKVVSVVECLKIPHTLVKPKVWQKEMFKGTSESDKTKDRSLLAATRLFPREKWLKTKDGRYDACNLAVYGHAKLSKPKR